MIEQAAVLVLVSPELVKQLQEWSAPVRVKVVDIPDYPWHEMIIEAVEVPE